MTGERSPVADAQEQDERWFSLVEVLDAIEATPEPVVALSITGGGASGAYQAGALSALFAALQQRAQRSGTPSKATPRIIVGTSAGSLNAFGLLLDHLSPQADAGEARVASLWRTIGAENDGARFVVGRRRAGLVDAFTRWLRLASVRRALIIATIAVVVLLVNPVLFAVFALRSEYSALRWLGDTILEYPAIVTSICAGALGAVTLWLAFSFGRALFSNDALESTLATAAAAALTGKQPTRAELLRPRPPNERQDTAIRVVKAWDATPRPPDLIVTATDLSASCECLFLLASPGTYQALAASGWQVARIGGEGGAPPAGSEGRAASVSASQLFRCIVASTSIPGVFPSQRIELHPIDPQRRSQAHDFVDGGVLNNSPVNVAVDAGATHIISIELDPLRQTAPLDSPAHGGEPLVPQNLIRTFSTLLNLATTEDVYRTVAINKMLREASLSNRRVVELFRFAPASRDLSTLEFDGHYPDALSGPNPSLVAWLDRGSADALTGRPFWQATYQAWPS